MLPGTVLAILRPLARTLLLDTALYGIPVIHLLPIHFPEPNRLVSVGNFSTVSPETVTSEMKSTWFLTLSISLYMWYKFIKCCSHTQLSIY